MREMICPDCATLRYDFRIFDAQNVPVSQRKRNTFMHVRAHIATRIIRIAHRIAKVELGSTPAICLATPCDSPAAKTFRSESLDHVARSASHRRSDVVHRALHKHTIAPLTLFTIHDLKQSQSLKDDTITRLVVQYFVLLQLPPSRKHSLW